jgi:hypothetical protein
MDPDTKITQRALPTNLIRKKTDSDRLLIEEERARRLVSPSHSVERAVVFPGLRPGRISPLKAMSVAQARRKKVETRMAVDMGNGSKER